MKILSYYEVWEAHGWRHEADIEIRPGVTVRLIDDSGEVEALSEREISKEEILEAWSHFAFGSSTFPNNIGAVKLRGPHKGYAEMKRVFGPVDSEAMFTETKKVTCPDCLRTQKMPVRYEEGKEGCADCGCSIAFKAIGVVPYDGSKTRIWYECQLCDAKNDAVVEEIQPNALVKLTCSCGYKGAYAFRMSLVGSVAATYYGQLDLGKDPKSPDVVVTPTVSR